MQTFFAYQDDTLDAVIFRECGTTAGLVEMALAYNPHLADKVRLEMGDQIDMPDADEIYTPIAVNTLQLWD